MKITLLIHPEELTYKWIDRAAENGVDALFLHPRGGEAAAESLAEMLELLATEEYQKKIDYAFSKRLSVGYEFHAASYLLPRSLFGTHPEYFRENENGQRTPDFNFCPSSEEALDLVAARAVELSHRLYRGGNDCYFWLDDVKNSSCRCAKCRGLSPSDQALTVFNRIITELKKENKNARLAYLAYHDTLTPPRTVKPEEGIFPEFAPIDRDFTKPVSACGKEYFDNVQTLLSCFGNEKARVLEYWFDNSLFSHWKKPPKKFTPDNDVIAGDIRQYASLGFDDVASFACFLGEDYEELYGEPDISAVRAAKER